MWKKQLTSLDSILLIRTSFVVCLILIGVISQFLLAIYEPVVWNYLYELAIKILGVDVGGV